MRYHESDIYDYQASYLINKLYNFLGPANVNEALKKYQRSLHLSGPVVSEYSLRYRHPWWDTFIKFFEIKKSGKSVKRHLTPEIKMLAADAKRIITLQKFMPESVQKKYKRDLIDQDRAFDYLFEIQIAWHFYLQGNKLQWYENDGEKHPEFVVRTSDFEFNVECKRISVDISRRIKREDFYRFAQKLLPEIEKRGYNGSLDIVLNEKLHSNQVETLTLAVLGLINSGKINGEFDMPIGKTSLSLSKKNEVNIKIPELYERIVMKCSNWGHATFFSLQKKGDCCVDPIEMSLKSKEPDEVLNEIYNKIYDAAKEQLPASMPGIIVCFLEEVYDLQELKSNSGLQLMSSKLLSKNSLSHIVGISYCSEIQIHRFSNSEIYDNQNLFFRNPNCKFEKAKSYSFTNN